jgi:predicted RNase H-like HicB family nuclease
MKQLICVVRPCKDISGEWLAHCLSHDVISQGSSIQQACEAIGEALQLCIDDDAANGRDFDDRNPAPPECWKDVTP